MICEVANTFREQVAAGPAPLIVGALTTNAVLALFDGIVKRIQSIFGSNDPDLHVAIPFEPRLDMAMGYSTYGLQLCIYGQIVG